MLAETELYHSRLELRLMASFALLPEYRVDGSHGPTGVDGIVLSQGHTAQPESCDQRQTEAEQSAPPPPARPSLKVMEVVALSQALGSAYASRHLVS